MKYKEMSGFESDAEVILNYKIKILKSKNEILKVKYSIQERKLIAALADNAAIKKTAQNKNQNPYIKVLEDEIKAKDVRIEELQYEVLERAERSEC